MSAPAEPGHPRPERTSELKALNTIIEVIRGVRPYDELRDVDINFIITELPSGVRSVKAENPRKLVAVPTANDVIQGLLRYYTDRYQLFEWATRVYTGGTDFIDYHEVSEFREGDLILNALWAASFGERIADDSIGIMRQIISEGEGNI